MTFKLADSVQETSTTNGTGTLSLGGAAATGRLTFVNGIGSGNTTAYRIDDGNGNWEETFGVATSGTPDTLTRGTLINSSTGSRITFGAGSKTVTIVSMAEVLLTPAVCAALAETSLASATTCDIGSVQTFLVNITGTTTITGFGTAPTSLRIVRFSGALTLTYNASSLILLSGASRTTQAGDIGIYISDGSGNWRETLYNRGNVTDGTFTPTDASGATLTMSAAAGIYRRVDNLVHAWGTITYPSTASGAGATIGGLPFTSTNGALNEYSGQSIYNGNGIPAAKSYYYAGVLKNTTTLALRYAGGSQLLNSDVTTYALTFSVTYPVT